MQNHLLASLQRVAFAGMPPKIESIGPTMHYRSSRLPLRCGAPGPVLLALKAVKTGEPRSSQFEAKLYDDNQSHVNTPSSAAENTPQR